ncbi:hypothetical protein QE452_001047 [Sphingomonas sp. SORGH_AS438]|nr:hypothetical protein [Sphingomonas sp. SORGH_AS_0438]
MPGASVLDVARRNPVRPFPKPDYAARPVDERGAPACEDGVTPSGRFTPLGYELGYVAFAALPRMSESAQERIQASYCVVVLITGKLAKMASHDKMSARR